MGVEVARAMVQSFWEVILAPAFTAEALEIFAAKKQLRHPARPPAIWPRSRRTAWTSAPSAAGFLVQRTDDAFSPSRSSGR